MRYKGCTDYKREFFIYATGADGAVLDGFWATCTHRGADRYLKNLVNRLRKRVGESAIARWGYCNADHYAQSARVCSDGKLHL